MKNILSKKFSFILILILILWYILLIFIGIMKNNAIHPEKSFCKATVNYEFLYENAVINYTLHHRFFISEDGSGYDNIRGTVVVEGEKFNIYRTLVFKHKVKSNKNDREMMITSENKLISDTMPDILTKKYLPYILPGAIRYVRTDNIDVHHILISDTSGPFFICSHN